MISKLIKLPVSAIVCRPQVRERFDDTSISELASTIKVAGIQSPILVWRDGNEWVLIDGELRLRGAREAGETTILAAVLDGSLTPAQITQRQIIGNQHTELTLMEKARAVSRYKLEANCSASEAATNLGMEPSTVSKLLSVASLPTEIQGLIEQHGLGISSAYQVSLAGNEEAQRRVALDLGSGAITRDGAAAKLARKHKSRKAKRTGLRRGCERIAVALGDGRSVSIAGPGMTLASVIEWLTGLVERLRTAHGQSLELSDAIKMVAQP